MKTLIPSIRKIAINLSLMMLGSCTTQMYVSNAVNAPLLKERGEVKINATPTDLQAAVAVTDHIGLMANGFYKGWKGDNQYDHHGGMGELGIGYFKNFGNHLVFENYIGGGAGQVYKQEQFTDRFGNPYVGKFNANAGRAFIQPGIGLRSRFVDLAFTPRFSFVKYTSFSSDNYPADELRKNYLENDRLTTPLFIFAEPAVTLRLGYKFIKLQAQYGLTLNVTGQNIKQAPDFGSLGLVIDIARWYR